MEGVWPAKEFLDVPKYIDAATARKQDTLPKPGSTPFASSGTVPLVPSTGVAEKDYFVSSFPVG